MRFVTIIILLASLNFSVASAAQDSGELPPGLPALGLAKDCSSVRLSAERPPHPQAAQLAAAIDPALTGSAVPPASLLERMRIRQVPGVSIAVIRNGRLSWAYGFGVRDTSNCEPVTPDTAFQAGSISKSLAAVLAMQAVEEGSLSLDRDINEHLVRWKLSPTTSAPQNATATLRQLLGHTAAVNVPDGSGVRPGEPIYDIVQALQGAAPAKGPPVHIVGIPGEQWSYSNGGYLVVQLALEDSVKSAFGDLAEQRIFRPLKMRHSSFDQPPLLANLASGHHIGRPFVDKAYAVPELAAGGLWSTPSDLSHFLIAVRAAAIGNDNRLLPHNLAATMVKPGKGDWGLGFSINNHRFGHNGSRWGMMSKMWIDRKTGDGIVVMSNGEEGLYLADEIIRTAANMYGWDGLQSRAFSDARDSGPIFLRGTMNDWGTGTIMTPIGGNRFTATIQVGAGPQSFKLASEDWTTFVLGASGPVHVANARTLDPEGPNIEIRFPTEGTYRFIMDAPDNGQATLTVVSEP
jgi:CubicO group peptidase (beta-lactamase class C family)